MKINRIFLFGDSWIEGQGTFDFIEVVHTPNQLGYEYLVDWLWETVISIRYKFI